jgi:hypothetical protein
MEDPMSTIAIPDVKGLSRREALLELEKTAGLVIAQLDELKALTCELEAMVRSLSKD